jgi:ribonuclease-3
VIQSSEKLLEKIGYQFKNNDLLVAALSHRSASGRSNERLEFLGDSVLNFIIASILYDLCPKAQEGELSRLRANLVKGETLAAIAQEFELGNYLRLGLGELKSGGAWRQSILADAFEAIIGAVYLDSGFETCKVCVLNWYSSRLGELTQHKVQAKDPKTQLQECLQARRYSLPLYTIASMQGAMHEQVFIVQCQVPDLAFVTTGSGTSRRRAEQHAAAEYLKLLLADGKRKKQQS